MFFTYITCFVIITGLNILSIKKYKCFVFAGVVPRSRATTVSSMSMPIVDINACYVLHGVCYLLLSHIVLSTAVSGTRS